MKKKKKIVFILRSIYPNEVGGVELTYYYLLAELQQHEIEPIIISEYRDFRFETWLLKKRWPNSIFYKLQILFFLTKNRNEYDFIHIPYMHTTSYYNWVLFPLVKKLFKKKYIISIHGGRMAEWKPICPHILFFKNAQAISATSDIIAAEYIKRSKCKIKVIPSQIPYSKSQKSKIEICEKLELSLFSKYFLIVGTLKKIKSPFIVLHAIRTIGLQNLHNLNLHFLFAGDGPLREEMEEYIQYNELSQYVTLLGNVNRESIADLYHISFAYIIASEFESFSMSLFEAIFNKVPVINSNNKLFSSILVDKQTSFFFNVGDFDKLAKIIIDINAHPKLIKTVAENAFKKYSDLFNYKTQVVDKYLEMYETLS